jgi:hypothetical protein
MNRVSFDDRRNCEHLATSRKIEFLTSKSRKRLSDGSAAAAVEQVIIMNRRSTENFDTGAMVGDMGQDILFCLTVGTNIGEGNRSDFENTRDRNSVRATISASGFGGLKSGRKLIVLDELLGPGALGGLG